MGFSTLSEIVDGGYCLSCGLCANLVPEGVIDMAFTPDENLRPVATRPLSADENARIARLCPGVSMDAKLTDEDDPVWGRILATWEGWASDLDTRFRASAGGVMTAINHYLLASGRADFILQARAAGPDALTSEPVMIRDPDELLSGSQSRYAPSAPLSMIEKALATGEKFAVSLKPCDIAGVRNLQAADKRARDQIVFTQAMFCGTVPSRETTWKMLTRKGHDPAKVAPTAFRWRGDGCPGTAKATYADGREVMATYNEMWTDARWTTQFRCKICPDAIGLQTDIATGDFWPGAVPTGDTPGENGIIAHTETGLEIARAAEAAGYLTLHDTDLATIADTQPHHVRLRQTFATRVRAATASGLPDPDFRGLAAKAAADQLPQTDHDTTYAGTLARLKVDTSDCVSEFDDWTPEEAP